MHRAFFALLVFACNALPSHASDFATEVQDATFKLYHKDSTATCFFIKREPPDSALYLVSAAHTLERMKGDTAVVVLRKAKDNGAFERRDYTITIRRDGKSLWVKHEKQDVAVMRLTESLPAGVTPLPFSALADAVSLKASGVHICSPLFILTYPQRFEANSAAFPVARQGIFSSPPLLPTKSYPTFLADFTNFAGDSGGPVFVPGAEGHPLVVGIVLAQFHHDERVKSEYVDTTIRHPLNLGSILHAQFVRETIETAVKAAEPAKPAETPKPVESTKPAPEAAKPVAQ